MEEELKIKMFLRDLAQLTKKYDIEICGCGCCGSPILGSLSTGETLGEELSFDEEKEKYEVTLDTSTKPGEYNYITIEG